jgi:hypothetical protein
MAPKPPAPGTLFKFLLACCLPGACATEAPVYMASYTPETLPLVADKVITIPATPVQYYNWVQAASLPELEAEHERLMMRPGLTDPVIRTVHMGTLLGVSALATPETEQEALALLDLVDDNPLTDTNRDYAAFAGFLRSHLLQRAELRTAQTSVEQARVRIDTLETSNGELQQQIDALTTLEQQLIEREQSQEP